MFWIISLNYSNILFILPKVSNFYFCMSVCQSHTESNLFLCFRYFSPSNNSLPKVSLLPTCFYGNEAKKFWNAKDYSYVDALNSITPDEFQNNLEEDYRLKESNFYKYPKCKLFSAMRKYWNLQNGGIPLTDHLGKVRMRYQWNLQGLI